ncbi:NACHT, LRR and PYD domains-containing protein 3-like [Hyperolius riggenbachi]|uniref:NACHT, LRR and PYD domains-containing protein 3-like n=1 Tax=Hyperolius riggenbachi TaxID=752182 RepID=UPI0035A39D4A
MATPQTTTDISGKLSTFNDGELMRIWEYYKDDLSYIVENTTSHLFLSILRFRNLLTEENYRLFKNEPEAASYAHILLQDISDRGREAAIQFFECLHALQSKDPNILVVLGEIRHKGKLLVEEILLDEHGHSLTPELKDIQALHKEHLMERCQTLVEYKPPGSTLEQKRFLINERYVNLIVVSTNEFRGRAQNELIQTGVKHQESLKEAQTQLEHIATKKLFRWSHQSQSAPNAVMVNGVPGIGKTTMVQKFVYDWVTGNVYQRFAFVFLYRFRELNKLSEKLKEVSLEEMILHQYPYLNSQLGNIFEHPDRLLFVFDGLDESIDQMDFKSRKLCTNQKQRENVGVIVVSLVKQSLLKGCSVLMTSRPTRLASIDTSVFQRITEILGFFHRDRQIYFEHFFENKELSDKAFNYVHDNDMMYTFCYIPAYCWIICTVLLMCFKTQPTHTGQLMTSLPKTVTQLFVVFIANILANHNQNIDGPHLARKLLTSVGQMAEYGVMKHFIVFGERDLNSFSVTRDNHLTSCFMMESGHPPDVDYSFLHLTLQEFFAALVHFINYDHEKLQKSLKEAESYKDGRAEIFLRFLCGLSDKSTRSMLNSHLEELSAEASRLVITWLQQTIGKGQKPGKYIKGSRELLNIFCYLQESRNKALMLECIGSKKHIDFSGLRLNPLDYSMLSFILESCRGIEEVKLVNCNVQIEGLRKLAPALHTIRELSLEGNQLTSSSCPYLASGIRNTQTLRKLNLSDNHLEGPQFSDLMTALTTSQIEELLLDDDNLSERSCLHLASGISDNKTLRKLDLSHNILDGPQFSDLMKALTTSQIEELHLDANNLPPSSCLQLASGIRDNQTLKNLGLSENNLKGPYFGDLMAALTTSKIETLNLRTNNLTPNFCPELASGIRNNQTLRALVLSYNSLEGPEFSVLMEALRTSRIEELYLDSTELANSSCPDLASGIRDHQTLRKLDLSSNRLKGPHFRDLMAALTTSRIEELLLFFNKLTDDSCPHLASAIKNNRTLKRLVLTGNTLGGPQFSDLMEALPTSQIEELHLGYNNLTDSMCPHLASGVRDNQTLRRLILSPNHLEGPHFSDLMTALTTSRIEELVLGDNRLTDSSCVHLASGVRDNRTLKTLNLPNNSLEGPNFSVLMAALTTSRIKDLDLSKNKLTYSSCPHLASGIRDNWALKTLDLSSNKLCNKSGRNFSDLMVALKTSQIEILRIGRSSLAGKARKELEELEHLNPGMLVT